MLRVPQPHPGHKQRGRGCFAISERAGRLLFAPPSLLLPLTPLFPLHTPHSPVSPLFPLHTQKQGGTPLRRYDQSFHFGVFLNPIFPRRSPCRPSLLCVLRGESSFRRFPLLATRHSSLTPIIPAPSATAALRVVPTPIFTTTLRIHVGTPTILFRERTTASQQFPNRRAMLSSNRALLTVDCELLFSPNSNHSRTYRSPSRKSNYSRTYARQGGGTYMVTYLRKVGAPTILRGSPRKDGPYTSRRSPGTGLKTGHYMRKADTGTMARETFCEAHAYYWREARRGVCRAEAVVKGVHCADPAFPGASVFPAEHHCAG